MERRKKFELRHKMYGDNYRKQVETKLGEIYTMMIELKLNVQINDNTNLFKQVVNAISNVYSFGVNRVFSDSTMLDIYKELRVDRVMTQANRYVNAFNDVILQVSYDAQLPRLFLRLPHQTEVVYNNNKVESVSYYVDLIDDVERWAFWSATEHYYIDKTVDEDSNTTEDKTAIEGNEDMTNPFGELPFVFMHNGWRDESFWDTNTGDDLVGGTIDLAIHLTFLNHLIKTNSFKQLVGKGDNVDKLIGQVSDPQSVLRLSGQNTEVSVLDMQANFKQLNTVAQDLANTIAVSYGISPNQFRMTSQASSGFALQMENLKLDRQTLEQQQDFKSYEQELFNKLQLVLSYYNVGTDDSTMVIDFVEPNYPTALDVQLNVDKQRIDLGLTSASRILMRMNPDLTDADAKLEIKDNLNARNELLNKVNTGGSLDDTIDALAIINNE